MSLRGDIENAINRASAENGSNTPDFILADYLLDCLAAFDKAVNTRSDWHDPRYRAGASSPTPQEPAP